MEFETLATGYGLVEGPRVDDQNRLYYSDLRGNGCVYRRSPNGRQGRRGLFQPAAERSRRGGRGRAVDRHAASA